MSETSEQTCVVIGASHAGGQLADSVRKGGWEGKIIVVGDEGYLPYHRPPLSKDFLSGAKTIKNIMIKPEAFYEKQNIEFMLNTRVDTIDRESKTLSLSDGSSLSYDKLGLALGARVRKVPIPGSDKQGVYYLRTADDIEGIRPYVKPGAKAVIVGGGYIGLETAASLRKQGMEVTVLEMMPRILQRVTSEELSNFYMRIHNEEGVQIHTGAAVSAIEGDADATAVSCSDGSTYPADLVIIGAGILPNIELAEAAGLEINGAIAVNEFAETSDADIVAAGDCTYHYNPIYERHIRLESVQNALDQAKVAGATICGNKVAYHQLPWFWSDQYDLKLQIAGLSQGFDDVVIRGDITTGRVFAAFYFEGDKFLAVDAINMPAAFMIGKRLLAAGKTITKEQAADLSFDMKTLLK